MSKFNEKAPSRSQSQSDASAVMQSQWQEVRSRLESDLPASPYFTSEELAALIRVEPKTLANDRSPSGAGAYPISIRVGRKNLYPRCEVLDWLADRELESRTRRIHRCL